MEIKLLFRILCPDVTPTMSGLRRDFGFKKLHFVSTFITNAIILGYENREECDRIYHLFTQKFGKMSVLAKGSRKILSKLSPHLEPPVVSKVLIAKGRSIDKLAGSEIKKTFPNIRKDFYKREILFFCFKIVNLSTRPEGADERVYEFLEEFIGFLEKTPSVQDKEKRVSIIISFLLRFFSLIGFRPSFESKNLSKEEIERWVSGILEKEIRIG